MAKLYLQLTKLIESPYQEISLERDVRQPLTDGFLSSISFVPAPFLLLDNLNTLLAATSTSRDEERRCWSSSSPTFQRLRS